MKKIRWLLVVGFTFFLAGPSSASSELDARYAFRSLFVAVINPDTDNVHSAHVQTALEKYFEARPRFDITPGAPAALRQVAEVPDAKKLPDLNQAKADDLAPWLDAARLSGADSALFIQMQRLGDDAQLAFVGAVTDPGEIVFRQVVPVADKFALASFGQAAEHGAGAFIQSLPFDATVISREGYRVVLDRGAPSFKAGTRVPVFTLEEESGQGAVLKETGMIQIQKVEPNLSFGTILVESRPLEVLKGNKARFATVKRGLVGTEVAPRTSGFARSLASVAEGASTETALRGERWGNFDLDLAASLVSWNRTSTDGTPSEAQSLYPGAAVRAQLKLTQDTFAELNGILGAGSVGSGMSSQANQLRVQLGYRLSLGTGILAPLVFARMGYSKTQFQVDDRPSVLGPSSASFEGLGVSIGCLYPLTEKWAVGLDMTALAFPSLSEAGGTSGGKNQDVTGWDFAVRGNYTLNDRLSLHAKLVFQTHSAAFSGVGTRPISLTSLSQNTRALLTGISYSF
jgi:hypothetical protein